MNGSGVDKLIQYCRQKLEQLINSDVRPIVVFDGNKLTMKEGVEDDRHRNRMEAKRKAEEFMR